MASPTSHNAHRRIGIGIDTGGTFTDAVAVDLADGVLLSKAKAPTTRGDLSVGVGEALRGLDAGWFPDVEVVALSTTLATNAVVEGKGCRVGLIVAVPDPATFDVPVDMPAVDVAIIAGAHSPDGSLRTPLDLAAAEDAVARMAPVVEAFAVSAYFGVSNAEHELALKRLVAQQCDAPVVCGHELSQRIGMVERATTAAFNARLLPLVRELLDAVRGTLAAQSIDAPLMVVKGDGSLTAEDVARDRPVETVLSGPAASVVGACRLSGLTNALVADMGGTTTDIAVVRGSMPEVDPDGALVGGRRTRVQALDVRTVGLGGDSRVRVSARGEVTIGPERAIPLSVAGERFPELREVLRELSAEPCPRDVPEPVFLTLVRRPGRDVSAATAEVFDLLEGQIVHIADVLDSAGPFVDIDALVRSGDLAEAAFTPTDLLAVIGEHTAGDAAPAEAGLRLLAAASRMGVEPLVAEIRGAVERRLALEVAARALVEDVPRVESGAIPVALLAHLLASGRDDRILRSSLSLGVPLVAVGAPAEAWFPGSQRMLGGELVVPEHAEVANAFGALSGRVLERGEALVKAEPDETFLVITPGVRERLGDYASAKARAEELAASLASSAAAAAGADDVVVSLTHDEVLAPQARSEDDVVVELTVVATASGRPFVGSPPSPHERGRTCA